MCNVEYGWNVCVGVGVWDVDRYVGFFNYDKFGSIVGVSSWGFLW